MSARVAVLMSTYNGQAFLEQQLQSLCAQADVDLELFVRDDGSRDETLSILRRYADRWPRLAHAEREENLGPARSFMELVRRAGPGFDYYAFCDQDDVWLPDKLARAVNALSGHRTDLPLAYCSQVRCVDEALRPLGSPPFLQDGRFAHVLFENVAIGCTLVFNAAAQRLLSEPQLAPLAIAMHDWWCVLVVAAFGSVICDPEARVLYRQHRGNSIGARSERLASILASARAFARDPGKLYPIHGQAGALLQAYGAALRPDDRQLAQRLVQSKRTPLERITYALTGPMRRQRRLDAVVTRSLIAFGWY